MTPSKQETRDLYRKRARRYVDAIWIYRLIGCQATTRKGHRRQLEMPMPTAGIPTNEISHLAQVHPTNQPAIAANNVATGLSSS